MTSTANIVLKVQTINPSLSVAQKLAIAELSRTSLMTLDEIVASATYGLEAVADVQIDIHHRSFMTQKPLHQTDCLICGALRAKAGA
jgi:hypothetical protein